MGSKNHEVVPTPLIGQIAGLRGSGGHNKSISALAKVGLIAKVKNSSCECSSALCAEYVGSDSLQMTATV